MCVHTSLLLYSYSNVNLSLVALFPCPKMLCPRRHRFHMRAPFLGCQCHRHRVGPCAAQQCLLVGNKPNVQTPFNFLSSHVPCGLSSSVLFNTHVFMPFLGIFSLECSSSSAQGARLPLQNPGVPCSAAVSLALPGSDFTPKLPLQLTSPSPS